ncbi:MAG TPA: ribonuclease HI family protein, partial [Thermoanaerobacterales bacterium]|nr:ribonuclease HI family protein [Thermoanaerobacterales bacterium]
MNKLVVFTDGASRGNPGKAGVGVAIYDGDNNLIEEYSEYIGNTTNNVAEYTALKVGIERAIKLKANNVDFNLDSELIVKQLNGEYKVRNDKLKPLYFSIK